MKKIRTLVVDDEPLARARIIKLLEQADYITLIGECKNGREALQQMEEYRPDLVFLDIQMPDLNGFEVLSREELHPLPFIIFVTAYNQYALKAFDVHAVDYLLKPYDDERFMRALEHARQQINLKQEALLHKKMLRLLDAHQHEQNEELQSLEVKEKGRTILVKAFDIRYIESDGNYLKVHTPEKAHLIRCTLQSIEEQLNNELFLRIHRSLLVNTQFIREIKYEGNNQYAFYMKDGRCLISSRSYREAIHNYLDEEKIRKEL
ncbi:MAG: response regulator transcription factor [Phaeodactylibacter sp.]|nr:response regulator transcription factor [Phaeodactylibacter sp.]MCB0596582.1 response regulator transcription factor [Phaeodactylibacter sp.]MCB9050364.1 response regulator transcription factor [Lewinellaceae bacterium]